jgi:hypothetical protein
MSNNQRKENSILTEAIRRRDGGIERGQKIESSYSHVQIKSQTTTSANQQ